MEYHPTHEDRDRFGGWTVTNLVWLVPACAVTLTVWALWRHVEDGTPITLGFPLEVLSWWVFGLFLPVALAPPAAIYLAIVWRLPRAGSVALKRVAAILLGPAVFIVLTGTIALLTGVGPDTRLPLADVALWMLLLPAIYGALIRLPVR